MRTITLAFCLLAGALIACGGSGCSAGQTEAKKAAAALTGEDKIAADKNPQCKLFTAAELAKYMQPIHIEGLRQVVRRFMEDGAKANIKRFSQAVELTACRAGLLLCGDLEIAKKIIAAEPQVPGDLPPQDKLKELVLFSISPNYFALRKALGITIG